MVLCAAKVLLLGENELFLRPTGRILVVDMICLGIGYFDTPRFGNILHDHISTLPGPVLNVFLESCAGPQQVWETGGCGNYQTIDKKEFLFDKTHTVASCDAACAQRPWCTHFFLGLGAEAGKCMLVTPGCVQDSNTVWTYYKTSDCAGEPWLSP